MGVLIFQWVFIALVALSFVYKLVYLYRRRRKEKWISRQPVQRVRAKVVDFRLRTRAVAIGGGVGSKGDSNRPALERRYIGTFELEDGSTVELEMPKGKPEHKGKEIVLEYRGDRFVDYQGIKKRKNKRKRGRF